MKRNEPLIYRVLLVRAVACIAVIAAVVFTAPGFDARTRAIAHDDASDGGELVAPIGVEVLQTKADAIEPLTTSY